MNVLKWVGDGLRALGGLALPMFAAARDVRRVSPAVLGLLHALLLAAVLALLAWVHRRLDLDRFLWLPAPGFRGLWLPLLFLTVYVLCWLGRWLWDLLSPEQETSVFPDIDQAWHEAVRALDQAGVDLTASPLFLTLGRPQRGEEPLIQGVQPRMLVAGAPRQADSPVRVYANREGIYVAATSASLLGRQAALLAVPAPAEPPGDEADAGGSGVRAGLGTDDGEGIGFRTLAPATIRASREVEEILARARAEGRDVGHLLEEEKRAIGLLTAAEAGGGREEPARPRVWLSQDRAEAETYAQRLQHLCRLIARERRPFCPINGALLVVPIAAGQSDEAATQIGLLAQRDLAAVRQALRVNFPVFALVCDLETLPGFRELTARLGGDQRDRRLGQRFPLVPDVERSAIPGMIENGLQQLGNRLVPNLVSTLWRVESAGGGAGGTFAEAVRGNVELYRLVGGVRDCQKRLARALSRAVLPEGGPPVMLGGCYLAGTGPDPAREQAFVPGVFRRLIESQDFVSWTPDAIARDQAYSRWTRSGYVALGLLVLACLGVIGYSVSNIFR
jgi:hypothetical protein